MGWAGSVGTGLWFAVQQLAPQASITGKAGVILLYSITSKACKENIQSLSVCCMCVCACVCMCTYTMESSESYSKENFWNYHEVHDIGWSMLFVWIPGF